LVFSITGLSAVTIISVGPNQDFTDIQPAISYALGITNDNVVKIQLHNQGMDYTIPSTGIAINIGLSSIEHLIIESFSYDDICTITHNNYYQCLFIVTGAVSTDKIVTFNHLRLKALNGYAVRYISEFQEIQIQNCVVQSYYGIELTSNCSSHNLYIQGSFFDIQQVGSGGGVALIQAGYHDNIYILNNVFSGTYNGHYFDLLEFLYAEVKGNNFNGADTNGNIVKLGICNGSAYSPQNGTFTFANNNMIDSWLEIFDITGEIVSNVFRYEDSNYGSRLQFIILRACLVSTYSQPVSISKNLFLGLCNFAAIEVQQNAQSCVASTAIELNNNTFRNSGKVLRIFLDPSVYNNLAVVTQFYNCILYNCASQPVTVLDYYSNALTLAEPIELYYSLCYPEIASQSNLIIDQTCIMADPLMDDSNLPDSYSLIWSDQLRSPCINAGYSGEDNELTDPDGTPPDIGCFYYPHYHQEYPFDREVEPNIFWLSFPVLDDRTHSGETDWNELGYLFQYNMGVPPNSALDQIQWSYNGDDPIMRYIAEQWRNTTNRSEQPIGYKVKFNPGIERDPVIVDGFKADAENTPASWVVSVTENGQTLPFENWIGYYVPYTQKAGDAFSRLLPGSDRFTYLDYIYTIKTQKWGTCRINEEPGSPWIVDPNTYTLSEGDMASLLLLPEAPKDMYWATLTTPSDPIEKPQATAFTYEEKLDYTPVFIEFAPGNLPDEVGLYVDGECLGAAVVDSTIIDVCFYNSAAKEGGELEVVFYYESKGKKAATNWKLYNPASMVFEPGMLNAGELGNYAYLSFSRKNGESPVPLVTGLLHNYPNPFNPSTTISFILSGDMEARLDIYNLRGQKVRSLQNGPLGKGKHTVTWDGRDGQGLSVSSGVYFSRLTTPEGSFIQKMMLMK
jgi:hypothetical protein